MQPVRGAVGGEGEAEGEESLMDYCWMLKRSAGQRNKPGDAAFARGEGEFEEPFIRCCCSCVPSEE